MALTKETITNFAVVGEDRDIIVKEYTVFKEDGVVVSTSPPHTRTVQADADVTNETSDIKGLSGVVHTKEVKDKLALKKVK